MRMGRSAITAGAAGLLLAAGAAAPAFALQPPREDFPLGQSGRSGAVCEAVRDWSDPAATADGARAWQVKCRGWTQTLGRLYLLPDGSRGQTPWRTALAQRADCEAPKRLSDPAARGQMLASCKLKASGSNYVVYTLARGRGTVAAEGLAPIADVLQSGLKVTAGEARPPKATERQQAEAFAPGGDLGELTSAAATQASLEAQRESAYRQGQAYQFSAAEASFQQILGSSGDSPTGQAEAALNLALNVSNSGRFAEADRNFAEADKLVDKAGGSASLRALALNYEAAHARNQRRFDQAVSLADQAIRIRARSDRAAVAVVKDGDALVIGPAAEAALNGGARSFSSRQLTPYQIEAARDVQALQIEGTSLIALGRGTQAHRALLRGADILQQQGLASATPWLAARLQADLAELDLDSGQRGPAIARMQAAVAQYRRAYPGELAEGRLLMELAAMQGRAGQVNDSLLTYEEALDIFRRERGALGGSADLAGRYFDELLKRIGSDPAAHRAEVERFFDASQSVVSEASAVAAAQFAARISQGDDASAGISRARDDTRRQIDATQGEIDTLRADIRARQTAESYAGLARTQSETQLATLQRSLADLKAESARLEQQLLQANPRYGAVLDAGVTLKELQGALKPGEAYVKILLLSGRGYGLFITSTEARPYAVDLTRTDAEALVAKVRKPFDDIERTGRLSVYDTASAHALYAKLFGPVEGELMGSRRLIYEPDAVLIGAPVGALVLDSRSAELMTDRLKEARLTHQPLNYAGVNWLGGHLESSVAISTASFWQVRRLGAQLGASRAPHAFIGFGDPKLDGDPREFASVVEAANGAARLGEGDVCSAVRAALYRLKPLPGAAKEVETVGADLKASDDDIVLGARFTDTGVLAEGARAGGLDQYRVLYFATHGLLPLPNGCLKPALVTSLGAGKSDALLDMDEIFDLKLDAEMVVLAACDTGRVGAVAPGQAAVSGGGEALGGLVRAFLYAGARNLVVSNWPADSTATERLMTAMFARVGDTQADALRQAQLEMMRTPDRYSHPGYWAAFTIVGDGARAMPGV
jgi:CHAT domain-containing protein